jgi:hypothetical protein
MMKNHCDGTYRSQTAQQTAGPAAAAAAAVVVGEGGEHNLSCREGACSGT